MAPDQLALARQLAAAGLSSTAIGEQLGLSYQQIQTTLPSPVTPEVEATIRDMMTEDATDAEIGAVIGKKASQVGRIRARLGLARPEVDREAFNPQVREYRRREIERQWTLLMAGRRFRSYRIGGRP